MSTVAAVGLAADWLLRGSTVLPLSVPTAATALVALAILAYPLLIGERLLANTPEVDLPEGAALRSLLLMGVVGLPLTGMGLLLLALGVPQALFGVGALAWLGALVSIELAARALMRAFLPRPDENAARAACRSLLATLLAEGTRPGSIAWSIRRNVGVDFARSWALSFVRAALPPAALGLAVLAWGLTGLAVVGPDERAIVERLGSPVAVLPPGLHHTWPCR